MFSVLIPVYNHQAYLTEAVYSALSSPLVQEVLLADDGSSDMSPAIVRQLAASNSDRVRDVTGLPHQNIGAHARLNALSAEAKGSWLAILNSDDFFVPGRFALAERHAKLTLCDFLVGAIKIVDRDSNAIGRKRGPYDPQYDFPKGTDVEKLAATGQFLPMLLSQNFIATTSNMIFKRALFERIGGFRDFRYCHDWDFAIRATILGRPAYVDEYMTGYRLHGSNTITASFLIQKIEVRAMLKTLSLEYPELLAQPLLRRFLQSNRYVE